MNIAAFEESGAAAPVERPRCTVTAQLGAGLLSSADTYGRRRVYFASPEANDPRPNEWPQPHQGGSPRSRISLHGPAENHSFRGSQFFSLNASLTLSLRHCLRTMSKLPARILRYGRGAGSGVLQISHVFGKMSTVIKIVSVIGRSPLVNVVRLS